VIPENQLRAIQKIAQELQDSRIPESCQMASILFAASAYGFAGGSHLKEFADMVNESTKRLQSEYSGRN
jgi:hypothetical protein